MRTLSWLAAFFVLFLTACDSAPKLETNSNQSPELASPQVSPELASPQASPDKLISSGTTKGRLVNFLQGDYFYAIVESDEKKSYQFFLENNDADCFLAQNKGATLSIQFDNVERFIPEANGYRPIILIRAVSTEQTDWKTWQRSMTPVALKQCRELVEKTTKSS